MYKTQIFSTQLSSDNETSFLKAALKYYLRLCIGRFLRFRIHKSFRWRTPETVGSSYDANAARILQVLENTPWDEYIFGKKDSVDFILLHDRVIWASTEMARSFVLSRIEQMVDRYSTGRGTVVEFGSGSGRNLLYLKKRFPHITFVGFELSPVSVQLSRQAASKSTGRRSRCRPRGPAGP